MAKGKALSPIFNMNSYDINIIRSRYALVPRTLIFVQNNEKVLFLEKKQKTSYGYGKINGLGGHIERGEEPFEAARREIREEAQIEVTNLEMAAILIIDINETPGILVFILKADYLLGNIKNSEEGDLIWLSREEISKNEFVIKDVPLLINFCDTHKSGCSPRIIKYLYDNYGALRIVI